MDLLPDDEQAALASEIRRYLANQFPVSATPTQPPDDETWREWAQMGWTSLGLPEAAGGLGCGVAVEALFFRDAGRFLLPMPLLASVLAAHAAHLAGDALLVDELVSGSARAVFVQLVSDQRVRVIGDQQTPYGVSLDQEGIALHRLDWTNHVELQPIDDSVGVGMAESASVAWAVSSSEYDFYTHALVLVSAQLAGIAKATSESSAEYAKVREQFGKPIGAFQAVSHRCADMALRSEVANMQTTLAALAFDEQRRDASLQALVAYVTAVDAATANAADNIQNHGGIGFTTELPGYRYVVRSQVLANLIVSNRTALDQILPL